MAGFTCLGFVFPELWNSNFQQTEGALEVVGECRSEAATMNKVFEPCVF